jgi:hypothetical protein
VEMSREASRCFTALLPLILSRAVCKSCACRLALCWCQAKMFWTEASFPDEGVRSLLVGSSSSAAGGSVSQATKKSRQKLASAATDR